jgi:hypothetical protein
MTFWTCWQLNKAARQKSISKLRLPWTYVTMCTVSKVIRRAGRDIAALEYFSFLLLVHFNLQLFSNERLKIYVHRCLVIRIQNQKQQLHILLNALRFKLCSFDRHSWCICKGMNSPIGRNMLPTVQHNIIYVSIALVIADWIAIILKVCSRNDVLQL